ncbi:MAG: ATPase domain-containing protein [Pyrobaculum sp.]
MRLELRGVTLVSGPAGAGKSTFVAWYTHGRYSKIFWVSAFEDEPTFRSNMKKLGYDFGEKFVFWEAPLGDLEAFFNTLVNTVYRDRPEALVVDSITAFFADWQKGVEFLHNLIYRVVRRLGVDVFLTAEREVAEKVAYVADNVIELLYEVHPYGALRTAVVKKIRGGAAGYTIPYIIAEGVGMVLITPAEAGKISVLKTGSCLDQVTGGLYKGALTAVVGPTGSGKTWLMLTAAKALKEAGLKAAYISFGGGAKLYAEQMGVEVVEVEPDLAKLLLLLCQLTASGYDAVFIRGLELLSHFYGKETLYTAFQLLHKISRMNIAVVVSLRDLHEADMVFDVIIRVSEAGVEAVRSPLGRRGPVRCG